MKNTNKSLSAAYTKAEQRCIEVINNPRSSKSDVENATDELAKINAEIIANELDL